MNDDYFFFSERCRFLVLFPYFDELSGFGFGGACISMCYPDISRYTQYTHMFLKQCNKVLSSALPCIMYMCVYVLVFIWKVLTVIIVINPIVDLSIRCRCTNTIIIVYFIAFMPFNFSCFLLRFFFFFFFRFNVCNFVLFAWMFMGCICVSLKFCVCTLCYNFATLEMIISKSMVAVL